MAIENKLDLELSTILTRAYEQSPLIQKALYQQQRYHSRVQSDQNTLLQQNSLLFSVVNEKDVPALRLRIMDRIDRDIDYVQKLNAAVNAYPDPREFTWSLKTNKMEAILLGAKELISNDMLFNQFLQGHLFGEYENTPPPIVLIGNATGIYGNSKATFLSCALLETHLELQGQESKIQDLQTQDFTSWVDSAAIAHVTPISAQLDLKEIIPSFDKFSFYFSDDITPQGLVFVHTGYAFGGQRSEQRYDGVKDFGPEDCSSWIAKLMGIEDTFTTIDELYIFRMNLPEENRGYIDSTWLTTGSAKAKEILSPVFVEDPFNDIHPGQVFAYRKFDSADHFHSVGTSGHTGIVLGVRENGNVLVINDKREIPDEEGYGIFEFPWASTEKVETMFFNVKSTSISIESVLSDQIDPVLGENLNVPYIPPILQFNQVDPIEILS